VPFIEENDKLKDFYKPGYFIGRSEMNKTEQKELLENFKNGTLNLIFATSVAEEGLDIRACNLVIRYDIMDSVTALIQSRGRARAKNSEFIIIYKEEEKGRYNDIIKMEKNMSDSVVKIMNNEIVFCNKLDLIDDENESLRLEVEKESVKILEEYIKATKILGNDSLSFKEYGEGTQFTTISIFIGTAFESDLRPSKVQAKQSCCFKILQYLTKETLKEVLGNRFIYIHDNTLGNNEEESDHLNINNPKGFLNEYCQVFSCSNMYKIVDEYGAPNKKTFVYELEIKGKKSRGSGPSKTVAQAKAAENYIKEHLSKEKIWSNLTKKFSKFFN